VAMNGAAGSEEFDRSGQLAFVNSRAQWYWRLREALDPTSGQNLALPPSAELRADLCAPRWKLTVRGIQVEAKDDIAKRIGRSPDCGDAAVYAAYAAPVLSYDYTARTIAARPAQGATAWSDDDAPRTVARGGGRAKWAGL
jgi:hypothetical protein